MWKRCLCCGTMFKTDRARETYCRPCQGLPEVPDPTLYVTYEGEAAREMEPLPEEVEE